MAAADELVLEYNGAGGEGTTGRGGRALWGGQDPSGGRLVPAVNACRCADRPRGHPERALTLKEVREAMDKAAASDVAVRLEMRGALSDGWERAGDAGEGVAGPDQLVCR